MEIERKWLVKDWPKTAFPVVKEFCMRQGYITVWPTVRIREEALQGRGVSYVLCFKSAGGLSRKEIEIEISKETFLELEDLIGQPLIPKVQKVYQLPDGHRLEVNLVDEGAPTAFMYAEVEFESEAQALAWDPAGSGLKAYLSDEVTGIPGQSMGAYWAQTRGGQTG